jgi:mRNA-degrading endonuclease RelE of RelBE toxin-antitoxin system
MSHDIFQLSQTYMSNMRSNSRNNIDEIMIRRKIVLSFLNEAYCLGREVPITRVMDALVAQNVPATVSVVRQDIAMYRMVYRYFHGDDVDLHNKKNSHRLKPLIGLLREGFDSWDKILHAMTASSHDHNSEKALSSSPAFAAKSEQMSECMIKTVDVLQNAATLFVEYHNDLNCRERELEDVSRKNVDLNAYIAELQSVINACVQEKTDLNKKYDELKNACHIATETIFLQKQTIDRQKKKIDEMQTAFRLMQEVFVEGSLKDTFQNTQTLNSDNASVHEEIYMDAENIAQLQLPQLCLYCNKVFRYSAKFEEDFQTLSRRYQDAVVSSIVILSERGPEYKGLRTNKVQADYHNGRIKSGMMKCRIGRSFRLVWEIVDDALHVVGLFHKNKIGG